MGTFLISRGDTARGPEMRNVPISGLLGKRYSESRNVSTRFLCWSVSAL